VGGVAGDVLETVAAGAGSNRKPHATVNDG